MKKEIQETRLKVFIENARVLPESEVSSLSQEKREAVSGKTGLWLDVDCPEGACSLEKKPLPCRRAG